MLSLFVKLHHINLVLSLFFGLLGVNDDDFFFQLIAGEIRQSGERVGFEVVTLDGRTGPLASDGNSK